MFEGSCMKVDKRKMLELYDDGTGLHTRGKLCNSCLLLDIMLTFR
jgi:hypothetical protein